MNNSYSKALIQFSQEQLNNHLLILKNFIQLLKKNPLLEQFLYHPFIKGENKKAILQKLLDSKVDRQILHFLFFLIDKSRIHQLYEIINDDQLNEWLGITKAYVITAVPLEKQLEENIQTKLEKVFRKKVQIISKINPQILGGMVVMIGDQMLDLSLKQQLVKLQQHLSRSFAHAIKS